MKAVQFDATPGKYLLTLLLGKLSKKPYLGPLACTKSGNVTEPKLPGDGWVKVRTRYGGICGSDLNVIFLNDSPSTSPFVSFPFVFGHEALGTISEKGKHVNGFSEGDRVIVNPLLSCLQRNIPRPCNNCLEGKYSLCENFAHGDLAPGISTGFCKDTGGSWGEYFVAHHSQLHHVPEYVPDEDIIFTDPLASALHPVLNHMPGDHEKILITGMGVIGLLMVAALRAMGSKCNITAMARYNFQGELALKYGADQVVYPGKELYEELRRISGGNLYHPIVGKKFMIGGFDKVFDCVASGSTLDTAMKFTKARGEMVVVGLASFPKKVDWSPVWFKEIRMDGSFYYYKNNQTGKKADPFELAMELIAEDRIDLSPLLTHIFPIEEYRKAIKVASDKSGYNSIKVLFRF